MTAYRTVIEDSRQDHDSLGLALGALSTKLGMEHHALKQVAEHFVLRGGKTVNLYDEGKLVATMEKVDE